MENAKAALRAAFAFLDLQQKIRHQVKPLVLLKNFQIVQVSYIIDI